MPSSKNHPNFTAPLTRCIASASAALLLAVLVLTSVPGLEVRAAQAPETVTGLEIQVSSSPSATLTWNKVDCDGYKVCRDKRVIARVKPGTSGSQVTFVDENIGPGESHTYSVKAYRNEDGKEICSTPATPVKIVDGYTYTNAAGGGIKLTGYTGQDVKLEIPGTLDGQQVTEIGDGCFRDNPWPERINVPEGVAKIGDYAFECCSHLKKIYLPDSLREVGDGAFSGCSSLTLADFGDGVTSIGDGTFMACPSLTQIALPASLQELGKFAFAFCNGLSEVTFKGEDLEEIPERAFDGCSNLTKVSLSDSITKIGKRAFYNCESLDRLNGPLLKEVGDYAFERSGITELTSVLDDDISLGFAVFARNERDDYYSYSFDGNEKQIDLPSSATLAEGTFYGSPINGIRLYSSDEPNYKVIDGSLYTADGKTLVVYFPMKLNEDYDFEKTSEADQKIFHVPEGVTRIAPDLGMLTDYAGDEITKDTQGITFGENAFDKWSLEPASGLAGTSDSDDSSARSNNSPFPSSYTLTSLAGDQSLYREEDFDGYTDISDRFTDWCQEYKEANKTIMPFDEQLRLWVAMYCSMYKSDMYYNQMAVTLNGDTDWAPEALRLAGHEYEEEYLMADHGLSTELHRAKIHDDLVLSRGITDAFARRIAGLDPGTPITTDDLIASIGSVYEEKAMISTSASFNVSYGFTGDAGVMAIILASQDALNSQGTFCLDCFTGAGEQELLLDAGARFKVLDVGKAETIVYGAPGECTYVMLELLGDEKDSFELTDEECKCDNEEEPEEDEEEQSSKDDGTKHTGWVDIDGERYYFDENGNMLTGWHEIDGVWYYFSESGVLRK